MPPKTTIALDIVLSDMRPKLLGERPRYRVMHRNGATIEGKLKSAGDESVQFKDARGVVEIEKADIARIDRAVRDKRREQLLAISVFAFIMAVALITFVWNPGRELARLIVNGAFGVGVLTVLICLVGLRSRFSRWEPVFPPPGTQVVDDRGLPVGPDY